MLNIIKQNGLPTYKYLTFFAMLYSAALIASNLLTYKIISIGSINMAAASLVFPFTYFCGDVVAEVYGYKIARAFIWYSLIIVFIFSSVTALLIKLPSPTTFHEQSSYNFIIGSLPRIFLGDFIGILTGSFVNVYVISKWKVILKGNYFWVRSLGSSTIGEFVATITAFLIMYAGVLPMKKIIMLMMASYVFKVIYACISVIPATIVVNFLKKSEGVDVYDTNTNFNPFKLETN